MRGAYPFLGVLAAFAAGIVLHGVMRLDGDSVAVFAVVLSAIAFVARNHPQRFIFILVLLFCCVGWLSAYSRWLFADDHIYFLKRKWGLSSVLVRGTISDVPRVSASGFSTRTVLVMDLNGIHIDGMWRNVSGRVQVNVFRETELAYGDEISVSGKLHAPFEFSSNSRFSYRDYLRRKGIYYVLSVKKNGETEVLRSGQVQPALAALWRIRSRLSAKISRLLPAAESAMTRAMLLGERRDIPEGLRDIFVKTGTAHIFAISGLHIGILAAVILILCRMLPGTPRVAYGLTIIFIASYTLMTGASPSVTRAAVMGIVLLIGAMIERETVSLNSLAFAGFLILALNPFGLYEIGFQLSFASVAAILIFYPMLMRYIKLSGKWSKIPGLKWILEAFFVSAAALIGVSGLILYYFEMVTPVSLLANLFAVPLSALSLVLGLGIIMDGGMTAWFAVCLRLTLNGLVYLLDLCQKIPGAYYVLKDVSAWYVFSYYCFVLLLAMILRDHVPREPD